jgi:hypothetical protein
VGANLNKRIIAGEIIAKGGKFVMALKTKEGSIHLYRFGRKRQYLVRLKDLLFSGEPCELGLPHP